MNLKQMFAAMRKSLGLTQVELADLMRELQSNISPIESEKSTRYPTRKHMMIMCMLVFIHQRGMMDDLKAFLREREDLFNVDDSFSGEEPPQGSKH